MIGCKILKRKRAVSLETAKKYLTVPVANVSDSMSRMTAGGPTIRPMHNGTPMSGPAFTVKCRPGDNLMLHKALELAQPGDVIIVDAGGDLTNAITGEIMMGVAKDRGFAGVVINGAIRDSEVLAKDDFPVFAAGVTHRGPYKDGPGEINVPIAIDGMVIEPGDLIIGDADGILCVPYEAAGDVLVIAQEKAKAEAKMIAQFKDGTYDASWVDAKLKAIGCYIEE